MCGRYTLATPDPGELRARFPVGESVEIRPRYNIAPGDEVLAVTADREGNPRGELLHWGLVPAWAPGPDTGLKMINARVEGVAERPAFRRAFERYRCLIIADGYYEWQAIRGGKQPFHITACDRRPFAFAGLWSAWRSRDGQALRSCAIVTGPANSAIAPLHDRMPVILRPDCEEAWLDCSRSPSALMAMLGGTSSSETAMRPVGTAVNDARCDGPECLAAPLQPRQVALF